MTASSSTQQATRSRRDYPSRLLVAFAILLLPLCFLGYGSDNDSYSVVANGYSTWHLHILESSRPPGYWTYEAIVYGLSLVGGSLASNLATLVVGVICLWRFLAISSRLEVRFPGLICACLVATPVFAIACTSTDDYVWSLLGIVLCAELVIADHFAFAIFPAAAAFAVRGANGIVIAGIIAGAVLCEWMRDHHFTLRTLRLVGVGFAAMLLGSPSYILSYHLAGNSILFAEGSIGPAAMWTMKMHVGRFIYKCMYLFGPLAGLVLVAAMFLRRGPPHPSSAFVEDYRARATPIIAGAVLSNLILFARFPIEISYLIPAAFFSLLLMGTTLLARSRPMTVAFLLATASLGLVSPQLAQPNIPGQSTDAKPHFAPRRGQMVDDVRKRLPLRKCADYTGDCFLFNHLED